MDNVLPDTAIVTPTSSGSAPFIDVPSVSSPWGASTSTTATTMTTTGRTTTTITSPGAETLQEMFASTSTTATTMTTGTTTTTITTSPGAETLQEIFPTAGIPSSNEDLLGLATRIADIDFTSLQNEDLFASLLNNVTQLQDVREEDLTLSTPNVTQQYEPSHPAMPPSSAPLFPHSPPPFSHSLPPPLPPPVPQSSSAVASDPLIYSPVQVSVVESPPLQQFETLDTQDAHYSPISPVAAAFSPLFEANAPISLHENDAMITTSNVAPDQAETSGSTSAGDKPSSREAEPSCEKGNETAEPGTGVKPTYVRVQKRKRKGQGVYGLTKVGWVYRAKMFSHGLKLARFDSFKHSLGCRDVNALSHILRHFETNAKRIKMYMRFSDRFDVFEPADISLMQRYSYLQLQIVRGQAVLVVSAPKRNKGLKVLDPNTVEMSVGVSKGKSTKGERVMSVFNYFEDKLVKTELLQRIKSNPLYSNQTVDWFDMEKREYAKTHKAVAGFFFVIFVYLMFIEGKYCTVTVKDHLATATYSTMTNLIKTRLDTFVNAGWKGEEGIEDDMAGNCKKKPR